VLHISHPFFFGWCRDAQPFKSALHDLLEFLRSLIGVVISYEVVKNYFCDLHDCLLTYREKRAAA
jgi:hypothetical protein